MSHPSCYTVCMIIHDDNCWTIRVRNNKAGTYSESSYFYMPLTEARRLALANHSPSQVVAVWPWVEVTNEEESE